MEKKQELKIENNFNVDDIKKKLYKAISISDLANKEVTITTKLKYISTFLIVAIVYLITAMLKCSNGVKLSFSIISGLMYFSVIYISHWIRETRQLRGKLKMEIDKSDTIESLNNVMNEYFSYFDGLSLGHSSIIEVGILERILERISYAIDTYAMIKQGTIISWEHSMGQVIILVEDKETKKVNEIKISESNVEFEYYTDTDSKIIFTSDKPYIIIRDVYRSGK
jgi:hypothetical protein